MSGGTTQTLVFERVVPCQRPQDKCLEAAGRPSVRFLLARARIRRFCPRLPHLFPRAKKEKDKALGRDGRRVEAILLSWNLGPKVNSRNRPKFQCETRLVIS